MLSLEPQASTRLPASRAFFLAALLALPLVVSPVPVPAAAATELEEIQKLTPTVPQINGRLGASLAMQGDVALIPASGEGGNIGAVYAFRLDESGWTEEQRLEASDGGANQFFGSRVAMDGDVAVVGATLANSDIGAAYVFRHDGTSWVEEQILPSPDGQAFDLFGVSVGNAGDAIAVGARGNNNGRGAVYMYRFDGAVWSLEQKLTIADGEEDDIFGNHLDMDDDVVVASAALEADGRGSVYVFRFDGTDWDEEQELVGSQADEFATFGGSLAIQGDRLFVGAYGNDSTYSFSYDGSSWIEEQVLTASDEDTSEGLFGFGVALDGKTALVAASGDNSNTGAAYLFRFEGGAWVEKQKIIASDGQPSDRLGRGMALEGGRALIGAENNDGLRGAAYAFFGLFCADGSVNTGSGATFNTLAIEGSAGGGDRTVQMQEGEFIDVTLVRPGIGGNGKFVLQAHVGAPGFFSLSALPFSIGTSCFPFLISEGSNPILVANNIGKASVVGASHFEGTPWADPDPATTTFTYPDLPGGISVTFQAILVDPGSPSHKGVSTTNAVILEILP